MTTRRNRMRAVGWALVMTTGALNGSPPAYAGMVDTGTALHRQQVVRERDRLRAALTRQDVRRQLIAFGVDPDAARARVAALSDEEVHALAGKVGTGPAGGEVVEILVFLFVLLLITDILGFTDIFPFVKKTAH